jgi:hypothetical protein
MYYSMIKKGRIKVWGLFSPRKWAAIGPYVKMAAF